jgi:hypothetical protein
MAGKEVEKTSGQIALTAGSKMPERVGKVIALEAWAQSVAYGYPYDEPDPEFISRMLAVQAIMGETVEEVMASMGVDGLQEILPDKAGESTGPIEITDLYVASSDFQVGAKTFVIITYVSLLDGSEHKTTTGAIGIQSKLIGLLKLGHFPIQCQFKRGDSKDKGGKFLIHLLPPD